jgi:hypothetical protein
MAELPEDTFQQATINVARLRTADGTLVILLNGFSTRSFKVGQSVRYKDRDGLMQAIAALQGATPVAGRTLLAEYDKVKGWTVWGSDPIPPTGDPA